MKKTEIDVTQLEGCYSDIVSKQVTQDRILLMTGSINCESLHLMALQLRFMKSISSRPITLYINSGGGNVMDGLAFYDMIRDITKTCPVHIIVNGICMSLAVIVLQAGTKRLAKPHSYFMMHEISSIIGGKVSQLQDDMKFTEHLQSVVNGILSKHTGVKADKLAKLFERKDYFVNAQKAKQYHLIDGVIS